MLSASSRLPSPYARASACHTSQPARPTKSSLAAEQSITSRSTRSGYAAAKRIATIPAADVPCTCARATPPSGVHARLRCQAAVDDEAGARDEGRAVGGEIGDGVRHLLRRADAP
jgi:hypothetical protein